MLAGRTIEGGNMNRVDEIVDSADFGKPSAAKRGRRKEWPYVPVIDYGPHGLRGPTFESGIKAPEGKAG